MSIGENIKKYRHNRKLTQKQLGIEIDKKEITVRKYESGDITPSTTVIENIAKALGVTFYDLTFSVNEKLSEFEILHFKNSDKLESEQIEVFSYILDFMRNKYFAEYTLEEFKEEFKNLDIYDFVDTIEKNALIKLQNCLINKLKE